MVVKRSFFTDIFLFIFLLGVSFLVKPVYGIGGGATKVVFAIQIGILFFAFFLGRVLTQAKAVLLVSFIGVDYGLFLIPFFLMLGYLRQPYFPKRLKKSQLWAIIFGLYAGLVYLFHNVCFGSNLLAFPFWVVTFYSGILLFLYFSRFQFTEQAARGVISFLKKIIIMQLVIAFIQMVAGRHFTPGDWAMGSLGDAHKLGFYLLLLLLLYWRAIIPLILSPQNRISRFSLSKAIFFTAILLGVIILSDAKHVALALVAGAGGYFLYVAGSFLHQKYIQKHFSLGKMLFHIHVFP